MRAASQSLGRSHVPLVTIQTVKIPEFFRLVQERHEPIPGQLESKALFPLLGCGAFDSSRQYIKHPLGPIGLLSIPWSAKHPS